jgi:hypothetical protein
VKTTINKIFSGVAAAAFLASCSPEIEVPAADKGSLDLTNYVAIGNSITAGYADNALYHEAQLVAYPNLIAQQFKMAGGGEFRQPMVSPYSVGMGSAQNSRLVLAPAANCMGEISLLPMNIDQAPDMTVFTRSVAAEGPFNNMAVPGLKATTVVYPGYGNPANGMGNYNPFFTRMTADPASASILSEAAAQNPTFFSLYIGNDDVMGYALSGGTTDAITPSAGSPGVGFDASVDLTVGALMAGGAKGVIANIPEITTMPYFTTVPYNGLMLDAANAAALSAAYAPVGITFQEGYNGFIIEDAAHPAGFRQIQQGELILLSVPQDSIRCAGWGSMKAIPNKYVLSANEITSINDAITAYNSKLKAVAEQAGLAFVDVNAFMNKVKTGFVYNGIGLSTQFVSGGAFSLDGVHLSPIGNALLANEFIRSINTRYSARIPQVDATRYKGIAFP